MANASEIAVFVGELMLSPEWKFALLLRNTYFSLRE